MKNLFASAKAYITSPKRIVASAIMSLASIGATAAAIENPSQDNKAQAVGASQSWFSGCSVAVPVLTHHFPEGTGVNNHNTGLIGECPVRSLGQEVFVVAGDYKNSIYRQTGFVGLSWEPFHRGKFSAGVIAALDLTKGYDVRVPKQVIITKTRSTEGQTIVSRTDAGSTKLNPFEPLLGALHTSYDATKYFGLEADIMPANMNSQHCATRPESNVSSCSNFTRFGAAVIFSMKFNF